MIFDAKFLPFTILDALKLFCSNFNVQNMPIQLSLTVHYLWLHWSFTVHSRSVNVSVNARSMAVHCSFTVRSLVRDHVSSEMRVRNVALLLVMSMVIASWLP